MKASRSRQVLTMGDLMIKIEHLHKTYRSGFLMKPKLALKDVSFSVEPGQVYGFIGPNGAGKSTTIKVLTGLLNYDSGTVLVNGISPRDVKSRRFIGYSPEQPYFYDYLTGRELLRFYGKLVGLDGAELDKRIGWALDLLHANKDWIDRRLRSYSKGMMQRVGIAQAILGKPKLLILDEPMSGLDPMGRRDVREAIMELNRDGVTIFYSSHLLSDVESVSHKVAMIVDGKIVREGTVDEITESCGVEYHVRIRGAIPEKDLPEGVTPAGHPEEFVCADDASRDRLLHFCLEKGIAVEKMDHKRPSLEDILTEEIARADA